MDIRSCLLVQNIQPHLIRDEREALGCLGGRGQGVGSPRGGSRNCFIQEITGGQGATLLMCLKVTQEPEGTTFFMKTPKAELGQGERIPGPWSAGTLRCDLPHYLAFQQPCPSVSHGQVAQWLPTPAVPTASFLDPTPEKQVHVGPRTLCLSIPGGL